MVKKTSAASWPRWLMYVIPLALVGITVVTYYPSLHYAFQFDDEPSILKFYPIRHKTLADLFFTSSRWVSYWLNTIHYQFGQFEPLVYRRSNLIFHCLTGLLLFFLLLFLFRRRSPKSWFYEYAGVIASVASALFLLHPVQTQTVSYVIQGQLEGLSALACLLIISAFLFTVTRTHIWQKILASIVVFGVCVMACGTKEITIIAPFLVMLVDWFFVSQGSWTEFKKNIWLHVLIVATIWSCYVWLLGKNFLINVLTLNVEHQNNIGNLITQEVGQKITAWPFFISQFKVILHYLFIFMWPCALCVDYDWKLCAGFGVVDCILPLLVLLGIFITMGLVLRKDRINPYVFGMLWFFICLAPRSTIMPSTELVADYKTYLASIGWLLVIVLALIRAYQWACTRYAWLSWRWVSGAVVGSSLLLLALMSYERNSVWQSGLSFWYDIVCKAPSKARGYNNYGVNLMNANDVGQAIWCFKRAIALEPTTYPDPYNNLSAAYATQQHLDLAIALLRQSLRINPGQPKSFNNLGIYLMQKQQEEWAEKAFLQAISLDPHYGLAYFNLGRLYTQQDNPERAWEHFKSACTQADFDTNPTALHTYADTSRQLKKYDDAVYAYTMLLKLNPQDYDVHMQLANIYLMCRKYADAIDWYQKVMRENPVDVRAWCNCTEAYAAQSLPAQALEIIARCERERRLFPGMMVQKARCLHMLGQSAHARAILREYLKHAEDNHFGVLAQKILRKIEQGA